MDDRYPYALRNLLKLGLTRGQARWWEQKGYIKPFRQGRNWRRYGEEDCQRAQRILILLRKGLRLEAAAKYEGRYADHLEHMAAQAAAEATATEKEQP